MTTTTTGINTDDLFARWPEQRIRMDCCNQKSNQERRRSRWPWLILLVSLLVAASTFLADARAGDVVSQLQPETNAVYLVMPDESIDPGVVVDYRSCRVFLCCKRCQRSFQQDPEAYVANLPAKYFDVAASQPAEVSEVADAPSAKDLTHSDQPHHAHDHGTKASGSKSLTELLPWLGKFHPPATHFPVALLLTAAGLEFWLMTAGRGARQLRPAITVMVTAGAISAIGAMVLGWFNGGFHLTDFDQLMTLHRWLGTATGLWAIVLLALVLKHWRVAEATVKPSRGFRFLLLGGGGLVAATGFLGGALVFGLDHLSW